MLCVPEGVSVMCPSDVLVLMVSQGMNYDWDQTYIIDGTLNLMR